MGLERLELSTSRLSGVRSSHLSYRPSFCAVLLASPAPSPLAPWSCISAYIPGVARALSLAKSTTQHKKPACGTLSTHRVGSSQVNSESGVLCKGGDPAAGSPTATLLRLHPNHRSYRRRLSLLLVDSPVSGKTDFRGVTGGVYKARERIHPGMLIRNY